MDEILILSIWFWENFFDLFVLECLISLKCSCTLYMFISCLVTLKLLFFIYSLLTNSSMDI